MAYDNKEADWDFYLQSIDPYIIDSNKAESTPSRSYKDQPKIDLIAPKPLQNGATLQQISDYNRNMQKASREQLMQETKDLYKSVENMGYQTEHRPIEAEMLYKFATSTSVANSGYSAKKINFGWGGKISKYKYVDYEFIFESTNAEHTERMMTTMSQMAVSGWEVDLNRSFQRVSGKGAYVKAHTTTQMRFRRYK